MASCAVLLFHAWYVETSPLHATLDRLPEPIIWVWSTGYLGVSIFFVLSGFVIAGTLRDRRISARYLGNFAFRRSLRLDPPYWTIVGLVVLSKWAADRFHQGGALFAEHSLTAGDLFANLFYLQGLLSTKHVLAVSWTLCLEVMFYLTYALLLALAQSIARGSGANGAQPSRAALAMVFGPTFLASICISYFSNAGQGDGFVQYIGQWHLFLIGAVLQWATAEWVPDQWFAGCASAVLFFNLLSLVLQTAGSEVRGVAAVATAVAIFAAARLDAWGRWLADPFSQAMGRISYSLYLVHLPLCTVVLGLVARRLGQTTLAGLIGIPLYLTVAALTAFVLNRFVEQPSLRWSRAFRVTRADTE